MGDELGARQECERCGGTLEVGYAGPWPDWDGDRVGVWRYRSWLPVADDGVTLGEGGTPLLRSRAFASSVYLIKATSRDSVCLRYER